MASWTGFKTGMRTVFVGTPVKGARTFKNWVSKPTGELTEKDVFGPHVVRAEAYLRELPMVVGRQRAQFDNDLVKNAVRTTAGFDDSVRTSLIAKIEGTNRRFLTSQESACLISVVLNPALIRSDAANIILTDILQKSQKGIEGTREAFAVLAGLSVSTFEGKNLAYAERGSTTLIDQAVIAHVLTLADRFAENLAALASDPSLKASFLAPSDKGLTALIDGLSLGSGPRLETLLANLRVGLICDNDAGADSATTDIEALLPAGERASFRSNVDALKRGRPRASDSGREAASTLVGKREDAYEKSIDTFEAFVKDLFDKAKKEVLKRALSSNPLDRHALEFALLYYGFEKELNDKFDEIEKLHFGEKAKRFVGKWDKGIYFLGKILGLPVAFFKHTPLPAIALIALVAWYGTGKWWSVPTAQEQLAKLEVKAAKEGLTKPEQEKKKFFEGQLFKSVEVPAAVATQKALLVAQAKTLGDNAILSQPNAEFLTKNPGVFAWLKSLKVWGLIEKDSKLLNAVTGAVKEVADTTRSPKTGKSLFEEYMEAKLTGDTEKALLAERGEQGKALATAMTTLERRIESIIRDNVDTKDVLPVGKIYSQENADYLNSHNAVWRWLNRLFRASLPEKQLTAFIVPENHATIDELVTIVRTTVGENTELLAAIKKMSTELSMPLVTTTAAEVEQRQVEEQLKALIQALEEKAGVKLSGDKRSVAPIVTSFDRGLFEEKKTQLTGLKLEQETLTLEVKSLETRRMEVLQALALDALKADDMKEQRKQYTDELGTIDATMKTKRGRLVELGQKIPPLDTEVKALGDAIKKADDEAKSLGPEGKGGPLGVIGEGIRKLDPGVQVVPAEKDEGKKPGKKGGKGPKPYTGGARR